MSLFSTVELAPRDPILGMTEAFNADPNPAKVNLGVGVYFDEQGKLPILQCVLAAEKQMAEAPKPRGYLPIDGIAAYDRSVQELVFGADSAALRDGRIATVQTLGGTGGLKVGADFLKRLNPRSKVLISDPSWENHRALFLQAGFEVEAYPYYDAATRGIRFDAMLAALEAAAPGTVVVLHACCHNPSGYDLDAGPVGAGGAGAAEARPGALPGHGLPGLRRRHRRGRGGRAAVPACGHGLPRRHLVLEELLAVRRARRRAQRGVRIQGRGGARAVAAEGADPRQLLQPADPRRARWCRWC